MGYISSNGDGNITYQRRGTFTETSPAILHSNLGWEFSLGLEGEILDGKLANGKLVQIGMCFKDKCWL